MYLRAAKTEAEEAGESTEGMANSVSELREELLTLTSGKVDIMLDSKNFKSTYEIMKDLADVWKDLADIDQANIIELIGGKRNSNVISSMLNNFETAEGALQAAANATGSAYEENEKYLDSIAGRLDVLSAKFEALSNSIINSNLVKFIISIGDGILNILNQLDELNVLIPVLTVSCLTLWNAINLSKLSSLSSSILNVVNNVKESDNLEEFIENIKNATSGYDDQIQSLTEHQKVLLREQIKLQAATKGVSDAKAEATVNALLLDNVEKTLALTSKGLKGVFQSLIVGIKAFGVSLKTALVSNPIGWISIAISLIPSLISLIKKLHKSNEELIEDAKQLKEEYNEAFESISGNLNTLRNLKEDFAVLSAGVDNYGNNISLTADEYGRYRDIVQTIVGITPELIAGYDAEGNAIANKNGLLEQSIQLVEEEQRLKKAEYITDEKLWTLAKGSIAEYKELTKSFDENNWFSEKALSNSVLGMGQVTSKRGDYSYTDIRVWNDRIGTYIEDAIGVKYNGQDARGSDLYDYIVQNYEAVYSNIDRILATASKNFYLVGDENSDYQMYWSGLSEDAVKDLESYFQKVKESIADCNEVNEEFNQTLQIIPQTIKGYYDLEDPSKDFITRWVNTLKINKDTTEKDIEAMSQSIKDFTTTLSLNDNLQTTISAGIKLDTDATSENLTVDEYRQQIQDFINSIGNFDEDTQLKIKTVFELSDNSNPWEDEVSKKVERVKNILQDEYDDAVSQLSMKELEVAYNISADTNSLTFDELMEKINKLIVDWDTLTNVLDFDPMTSKLDDIGRAVSNLATKMQVLANGTALTQTELADLALEYPKLLEASKLFTDGTVEGQQEMLDSILDVYEQQYDAAIDEKIAELEASQVALNKQIEVEENKRDIVIKLKDSEANGQIDSEEQLLQILAKFKDLEGQNYVTFKNGELQANTDFINGIIKNENDLGSTTKNIWEQSSDNMIDSYTDVGTSVGETNSLIYSNYARLLISVGGIAGKIGKQMKKALEMASMYVEEQVNPNSVKPEDFEIDYSGSINDDEANLQQLRDDIQAFQNIKNNIKNGISSSGSQGNNWIKTTTIDGVSISDWSNSQSERIQSRIDEIKTQIETNKVIIENLQKLKGLDLRSLFGSSGSGNGGSTTDKEIDEYLADIDEYYAALKRLEEAQTLRDNLEEESKHIDDPDAKIKTYSKLIDAYKEEAAAERSLITQRSKSIEANAEALRSLGFEVDYNAKSNKLFIHNLEHINELIADSEGEYDNLQEATNALRKETESLIDITENLNDSNRSSIDNIEDLAYEIQDVAEEIIDCIEDVYKTQIDAYNDIIDKRKEAIESAKDEYDYEEDIAEKVKEIAELQAKIDKLSLDNSRDAQAQRASLIEELQEKQKELGETQSDHAYDEQIDFLDKMSEQYEAEKNAEIEALKESIGTVQDLGTVIDTRVTNAWKNATKAVEEYNASVAELNSNNISNIATVGIVPKYHSGGVVGGNTSDKKEVLALLETGEIVLNDHDQEAIYQIVDFQSRLAERLGVEIGRSDLPFVSPNIAPSVDNILPNVTEASVQSVFSPEFNVTINHSGNISDNDARRYGEEIANNAIDKLYNAFERKGLGNHNNARLKS